MICVISYKHLYMAPLSSRRGFIINTGKAGLGVYIGSSLISSCSVSNSKTSASKYNTGFEQDPLPYNYNALDKAIDGTTMEIHYTKHAASYAANLRDVERNSYKIVGEHLIGNSNVYNCFLLILPF